MTPTTRPLALLAATVLCVGLSSCAPKEAYSGQPEAESGDLSDDGPRVVEATPRVITQSETAEDRRALPGNIINERLVFFDYDKSAIRDDGRLVLDAHTDYLVDNRGVRVILQGHADERGSTEYNLALGQRRSDAVREYMISGGVYADQIEAVSYGEERPRSVGATEAAYAENRRVEIVYGDE